MDYQKRLLQLAESCSDLIYGSEHGWEEVEFNLFVTEVREAIGRGNHCLYFHKDALQSKEE